MILIMIVIGKHQRSKLAKLFLNVHTTMVHYSENPLGMGVVVFAKVQGAEVKFESLGTPKCLFIKHLQISGEQ